MSVSVCGHSTTAHPTAACAMSLVVALGGGALASGVETRAAPATPYPADSRPPRHAHSAEAEVCSGGPLAGPFTMSPPCPGLQCPDSTEPADPVVGQRSDPAVMAPCLPALNSMVRLGRPGRHSPTGNLSTQTCSRGTFVC